MIKDSLSTKKVGNHPQFLTIEEEYIPEEPCRAHGVLSEYGKIRDLRYGTNPTQTAALYHDSYSFLGNLREIKTGKEGPSQTNMEDILYAALTVMYFDGPSVIIMKHENPCGFATQYAQEHLSITYRKAKDCDFRAAFGGTVFVNVPVDKETADAMNLFTEVLVAPGYDEDVVGKFTGSIRIFDYNNVGFKAIPKFIGDESKPELKRLPDGSIIRSDVFLSPIKGAEDLKQYIASESKPSEDELRELLTGYRIRLHSNSIRFVKNGYTTGIGAGQQDRIMCMEIAAYKNRRLKELAEKEGIKRVADYDIAGSCMISDGFFPFTDCIELAHELGIKAILAPHGGENFNMVLAKANEFGIPFVDLPSDLRFFDHH